MAEAVLFFVCFCAMFSFVKECGWFMGSSDDECEKIMLALFVGAEHGGYGSDL